MQGSVAIAVRKGRVHVRVAQKFFQAFLMSIARSIK
jgi:hypothetical protein